MLFIGEYSAINLGENDDISDSPLPYLYTQNSTQKNYIGSI
jgi:hypothetical protein